MISRSILFLFLLISCLLAPASAFSEDALGKDRVAGAQSVKLELEVRDGRIFMDVRNAEIGHVLEQIARKAKIDISIGEGVGGRINTKMSGVTIEDALKKLCENRTIVFEYLPENKSYRIIKVGAYTRKKGEEAESVNNAAPSITTRKEMAPKTTGGEAAQKLERNHDSKGRLLYKPGELLVRFKQGVSEKQIAELHSSLGSRVIGGIRRLSLQRIALRKGLSEKEAIALYSDD